MTPEEKRVKIAEFCGWKFQPLFPIPKDDPDYLYRKMGAIMCWVRPGNPDWETEELPDYLNNLDAMHGAESFLPIEKHSTYVEHLGRLLRTDDFGRHGQIDWSEAWKIRHVTAAELAEEITESN